MDDLFRYRKRIRSASNWAVGVGVWKLLAGAFLFFVIQSTANEAGPQVFSANTFTVLVTVLVGVASLYLGWKIRNGDEKRVARLNRLTALYFVSLLLSVFDFFAATATGESKSVAGLVVAVVVLVKCIRGRKAAKQMKKASQYKKCPECAEQVQSEARVCRYCGYRFVGQGRRYEKEATAYASLPERDEPEQTEAAPSSPHSETTQVDKSEKANAGFDPALAVLIFVVIGGAILIFAVWSFQGNGRAINWSDRIEKATGVSPQAVSSPVAFGDERRVAAIYRGNAGEFVVSVFGSSGVVETLDNSFSAVTEFRKLYLGEIEARGPGVWFQAADQRWRTSYYWELSSDELYYHAREKKSGKAYLSDNLSPGSDLLSILENPPEHTQRKRSEQNQTSRNRSEEPKQRLSARQIYRSNRFSMVAVKAGRAQGSGFIVRNIDGGAIVATNKHVIDCVFRSTFSCDLKVEMFSDRETHEATFLTASSKSDLALLKINSYRSYNVVELADGADLQVGDKVFALGSPQGLDLTLSEGIVSAFRRIDPQRNVIQITAPISRGSSGGALFNTRGEVVGVTSATMRTGQNLNFAVSVESLLGLMECTKQDEPITPEAWFSLDCR